MGFSDSATIGYRVLVISMTNRLQQQVTALLPTGRSKRSLQCFSKERPRSTRLSDVSSTDWAEREECRGLGDGGQTCVIQRQGCWSKVCLGLLIRPLITVSTEGVLGSADTAFHDRFLHTSRCRYVGNSTLDLPEWMYVSWEMSQEAFEPLERRAWGLFGPTKVLRLDPKSKAEAYQCLSPSNKFTSHKTRG